MPDVHDAPSDREREELVARIQRVAEQGRIGTADRDIRLANARTAQSRVELDLMRRDLDQLEASVGAAAPSTPTTYNTFDPSGAASGIQVQVNKRGLRLSIILVVLAFVVSGAIAAVTLVVHSSSSGSVKAIDLPTATTDGPGDDTTDEPADTTDQGSTGPEVRGGYSQSAAGITAFLAAYRTKFHTARVVELVMYPDYVVADVPVTGKHRQSGWLYREGSGWTSFVGVRATFPGARPVDVRRLDVAALVRNIARAKRTLKVEQPQAYVIVRDYAQIDEVPSVDVHVSNGFGESGYLATRLDGTIERAYPYAS